MKRLAWALGCFALGAAAGLGSAVLMREATRAPSLVPDTLPTPPEVAETPEPAPPAPASRPPVFDFFGFEVEGPAGAPEPRRVARVLRFVPVRERCAAGFDATSTLHDFRGWTKAVEGSVSFDPERLEATARATIVVDARTLDTGHPDRDREMRRDHLQSERFPEMKFELKEFRRTAGAGFLMKGSLEIRGRAKDVEMHGTFELRRDGHLHAKGGLRVRMSDFGISPPVTALVIRVDDEIRVWFELWARRQEETP
jgi:polyisoprenoid-binding protein YceI